MKKKKIKLCYFRRRLGAGVYLGWQCPCPALPAPHQSGDKQPSCAPGWWEGAWMAETATSGAAHPSGSPGLCLETLWFPLLPQTPQTGPSGHTCQGRSESMGWEDEHSLNLHHSPCPVLLLLVGIQMNKNALPQA